MVITTTFLYRFTADTVFQQHRPPQSIRYFHL
jgi:hypothetical protein